MPSCFFHDFDCFLSPLTAVAISCFDVSALHSFQNLTVALSGLILGSSIIILVGSNDASPTTKASPISRIGSTSVSPDKLSGSKRLITAWSSAFDNLNAMKLLHWLRTVLFTSAGLWLITV